MEYTRQVIKLLVGSKTFSSGTLIANFPISFKGQYYWTLNLYQITAFGFYFQNDSYPKGFILHSGLDSAVRMNFTGQHRCFIKDLPFSNTEEYEGCIVCANQKSYISMSNTIKKRYQAITQNESLPYVSLSNKTADKSCFWCDFSSEDRTSA